MKWFKEWRARREAKELQRGYDYAAHLVMATGDNPQDIAEVVSFLEGHTYGCDDAFDRGIRKYLATGLQWTS